MCWLNELEQERVWSLTISPMEQLPWGNILRVSIQRLLRHMSQRLKTIGQCPDPLVQRRHLAKGDRNHCHCNVHLQSHFHNQFHNQLISDCLETVRSSFGFFVCSSWLSRVDLVFDFSQKKNWFKSALLWTNLSLTYTCFIGCLVATPLLSVCQTDRCGSLAWFSKCCDLCNFWMSWIKWSDPGCSNKGGLNLFWQIARVWIKLLDSPLPLHGNFISWAAIITISCGESIVNNGKEYTASEEMREVAYDNTFHQISFLSIEGLSRVCIIMCKWIPGSVEAPTNKQANNSRL